MRMGGQRHAPAASHPRKRPGTHYTGNWVGPKVSLEGCGKSQPHLEVMSRKANDGK
jgi:hypothetical protein